MMQEKNMDEHYHASSGKLFLTLILAVVHLLSGFIILMVASWFIAACSIAGIGFNYMLPAVVIRALAILRISSGYFSMLVGHGHLLGKLAALRLNIFSGLKNTVSVSREASLDALHHQSEEVAAIWMSWVGQNAGAFLSLFALNILSAVLVPDLSHIVVGFSVFFLMLYASLLVAMLYKTTHLVQLKKRLQFDIVKHIEAAPLWHLYRDYEKQSPTARSLQHIANSLQQRIRTASLLLFLGAVITISIVFSSYAQQLEGNVLFIMILIALLSVNDWLSPTLGNQKQLLDYMMAKRAIFDTSASAESLTPIQGSVKGIRLSDFKASQTHMCSSDVHFQNHSSSVVIGSSGAGKSRFLQALSGLIPFDGQRELLVESGDTEYLLTSQGFLSDSFYLEQFPYVLSDTLAENLRVANQNASDTQLLAILKQVGLGHLSNLNQWLGEHGLPLSGGEKKRLGLARTMLSSANVLLLDEPFESLDDENIQIVAGIINGLSETRIVVLSTHILPKTLKYQQRIQLDYVKGHANPVQLQETLMD